MTINKTQLASTCSITGALGLAGKTISTVDAFRLGCVEVIDILCTDAVHYYIKSCSSGILEVGGTPELGTGKKVGGR